MKSFEITFAKIYPDFTRDLIKSCVALTSTEVKVCMMLKINYSNKKILDQLNISLGLSRGNDSLIERITSNPNFQDLSNNFDRQTN